MSEKELTVQDLKRLYPELVKKLRAEHFAEYMKKSGDDLVADAKAQVQSLAGVKPSQ
jgi:hypothetical protein